ncbi:hypothetical protein [Burkholderia gladioli]|uniref:hypothetical protein n=1 Tax=Burkholderia gladioli TaxID=28095 RepID=UPI001640A9D8|nr:hypothetical protein [Burkholderia gladioli]
MQTGTLVSGGMVFCERSTECAFFGENLSGNLMMRSFAADLCNAAKLLVAPSAFLAAERDLIIADAPRRGIEIADRAALVRRAFWHSAALVAIAFAAGWGIAWVVQSAGYALIPDWQLRLQAASAAILLWGTVFVRGWDIQSHGGTTLTERANRTLYLALYVVGTTLGVFATLCPVLQRH